MGEQDEISRGRLRRLNLALQIPPVVGAGVLLVVVDARTWWGGAILILGVVAALVAMERWAAGDLPRVARPAVLVAGAVWLLGALVTGNDTAFFGISVVGSLVAQLPRRRIVAAVGLVAFVAAVGVARLVTNQDDLVDDLVAYVLIPTGITVVAAGLMFGNQKFYDLMKESREREAELAVARERIRFAGDLHDIQGHTLHVVKLKTTLAQRLVHTDAEQAVRELREIHSLIADTIMQTKALAHAQRRLNLSAELENAKNLFEAAGIDVDVDREADVDDRYGELLGQVLRETATNVLRHAQATRVRITLTGTGIDIVNNGARVGPLPELSGLLALKDRLVEAGGELIVEQQDGQFRTAAAFPAARTGAARATTLEASR